MSDFREDDAPVLAFFIEEMLDGQVAGAVSRAVRAIDMGAAIRTDPATQRLDVEPSASDAQDIVDILQAAGFTVTRAAADPSSDRPTRIICKPAGKRRFSAWVDNEFLGHAIARVDGTWAVKAPDEQTFPGFLDQAAALRLLLELRWTRS